jgi:hypothetical protein
MASRGSSPQQTTDAIANTASPTASDDGKCREHRLRFLLGLPRLADGALWRTARRLGAPVLISANALSRWTRNAIGMRTWTGFDTRNLRLVHEHLVCLDSGGFVAAARYRGFPWELDDYLDLCAAAPGSASLSSPPGDRFAMDLVRIGGLVRGTGNRP